MLAGPVGFAVTSKRMRGAVAGHSVMSFAFNTVVLALLVSAIVSAG